MRTLAEMIADAPGLTPRQIADRTGRKIDTVRARLWQLKNSERCREMQRANYRRRAAGIVPIPPSDWSAADDVMLRRLWPTTTTAAQIGAQLNRSKNAVIGRARRLGLSKGGSA